ncbi:ShlB/FhaC/HecB family hemolysin secretion/activation protein [Herbaspirillum sp. WKF16]|uniref:ShlB/FhaC/HecB family hemolysin secretion/activation protein n=1 Tax=Herbaspirillum sp. WKF16 TaxID=3028312 RepID=UPI0023A94B23|nr:ShlB/FhaC/HecB family hemolysin secretion/activation protein [Herbaspirillum sp. WKF16]WDZ95956.1 ShlB/FhaC/HecB family hemolysin secretion/activation protein [Herbaspirillum sp. WKF16]
MWMLLSLAAGQAMAQAPDADAQRRARRESELLQQREQLQRQAEERMQLQQAPEVKLQEDKAHSTDDAALPEEAPCFAIRELRLALPAQLSPAQSRLGASLLPLDAFHFLQQALDVYRDKCIGREGLNLIGRRMSALLLARGYSTTRVGIPEQDLSAGTLTLVLIPGVIGSIGLGRPGMPGSWRSAFPARPGDLLNLRELEQGMEQMKRVPSHEVEMQISPGDRLGESDIVINVAATKPWRLSASLDDSGAKGTGKLQAGLNLALDNPLGLNDLFNVTLNTDADRSGNQRGTTGNNFSWSVPYGDWSFAVAAGSYRYHQRFAGLFQSFTSSGKSDNMDVRATWMIQRDQQQKNSIQFKIGKRWSRAYLEDTELDNQRRNASFAEIAWLHRRRLGSAQLDLSLANRWGVSWFNGDADPAFRQPGDPTLRYTLQTIDASLLAPFALAGQSLTYIGALRGQSTRSVLHASEQLSIGNRYTVRGFDGELSLAAERGFFMRNEIDAPLGERNHSLYAGLDIGKLYGPAVSKLLGDKLAGAALGMRGNLLGLSYDMFIGWALYKPQNFRTGAQAAGFSLGYQY